MMFQASDHSEQDYGFITGWLTQTAVSSGTEAGVAAAAAMTAASTQDPAALTGIALNVLPLRRGSRGPQVGQLQRVLKETGNDPGKVDNDFGPITEAAVQAFQRARGVPATGIVDETTLRWLSQMLTNVRQGGKPDAHKAPTPPPQGGPLQVTVTPEQPAFYEQPWFGPALVGTGLVVAAGVGYFLLRKR
jgi:peptidoglycan hydrolase-like protein with peptidoglycan-binding domain